MGISPEEFLARKKPNTRTLPFALDPEPGERLARARNELEEAKQRVRLDEGDRSAKATLRSLEERVAELETEAEAASYPVKLVAMDRATYDALLNQHPPTEKQIRTAEKKKEARPLWNEDSFPPALLAACMDDPDMAEDDTKVMWNDPKWSPGELWDMFFACRMLCEGRQVPQLGKGSSPTPD